MNRFVHYSRQAELIPRSVSQRPGRSNGKPNGLWVSVLGEDDWANWCAAESYGIAPNAFELTLREAKILWLTCGFDLDLFTEGFGFVSQYSFRGRRDRIDWARVAERVGGIVIAPYVWSRRLEGEASNWYYGWDCASGCIWDASAVESVCRVPELDIREVTQ